MAPSSAGISKVACIHKNGSHQCLSPWGVSQLVLASQVDVWRLVSPLHLWFMCFSAWCFSAGFWVELAYTWALWEWISVTCSSIVFFGIFTIDFQSQVLPLLLCRIKTAGRNINNLRYADDTTLMAQSEEELKSLLMKMKQESEKAGLKQHSKTTTMTSSPITSWQIDGKTMKTMRDFILRAPKSLQVVTAAMKLEEKLWPT